MIELSGDVRADVVRRHLDPVAPFRSVVALLEHQARATPDAIAITWGERHVGYAELHRMADAVALAVAAQLDEAEPLVALCVERGVDMVAGMIGIMKAGAAYLPLDPGLPDARLRQIIAEARPALVLASSASAERLATGDVPTLRLDRIGDATASTLLSGPTEQSLAYVLYTSGSTGHPKGVEVTHASVLNLLAACRRTPGMDARDISFAMARMSFDVSVLELFLPLSCGARIVMLPESAARDPNALARAIERHAPTVIQAPPALWRSLVDTGWPGRPGLRAWSGAEAIPRSLAERLLPLCAEVWNCYGPTEATVVATVHRVRSGEGDVPIGRPIAGASAAILDNDLRPVADGRDGELCIGGAAVARGYRGSSELTEQSFVSTADGERVYRTGDRARRDADGLLYFAGRIDDQINLRGFRVEPAEVEASLLAHAAVAACAVRAWPDAVGQNALCAYVVRRRGEPVEWAELKAHVRAHLPAYMVPQRIVWLDALPLTANGKVDRASLPDPFVGGAPVAAAPAGSLSVIEGRLAAIWRSLLGPLAIGPDDDFFDLGGYSLLTVRLLLHIEEAFGRSLSLAEVMDHSTLARMAAIVAGAPAGAQARRVTTVRHGDGGPPLVWLDPGPLLRPALQAVGGNVPVLGLNLAPEDERALRDAGLDVPRLAARIVEILRDLMGDRPFHLGGWCRWGIVACEVGRQMGSAGYPSPHLVLLDTDLPTRAPSLRAALHRLRRTVLDLARGAPFRQRALSLEESFGEAVGRLSANYRAEPYEGDITLVQPTDRDLARRAVDRWARVARGKLYVHAVTGDHVSMVHAQNAGGLGAAIGADL